MKPLDFSKGPIKIEEENINKINELLRSISKEKVIDVNELAGVLITEENQLEVSISINYDSSAMKNAMMNVLSLINFRFGIDSQTGSVVIQNDKEYFITPEIFEKIVGEIVRNFNEQMVNIQMLRSTKRRDCVRHEVKLLECIDRFVGYYRVMGCLNIFLDAKNKKAMIIEQSDIEDMEKNEEMFQKNRMHTSEYIVKRIKNYNEYIKALISLENAKNEVEYQQKFTINVERSKELVKECEIALQVVKDEYIKIDNEDKIYGNSIVSNLHAENVSN